MKNTEIITAHNVIIQYEIASLPLRIGSFLIDAAVLLGYFFVLNMLMVIFTVSEVNLFEETSGIASFVYVLFLFPVFFYSFFMESFFSGQTVGKLALGLRVINIKGASPSIGDLFLRWTFRMVEIVGSFGAIAVLSIMINENNQRIGGLVSNTLVIQLKPSRNYSIKDILKLKSTENYKATYPEIVKFTDDDVLFIKNALERHKKFKNKNHNQIILELSKRSATMLNLDKEPKNKLKFLKTLVQDYVVLTRS